MSLIIAMSVVVVAAIVLCLVALRRRSGAGRPGASERAAAAGQGFAQGLGEANKARQSMGPGAS